MSGDTRADGGADATLRIERRDHGVVALWLNRPQARNALDGPLVSALQAAFEDPGARAFVLGSADRRCFCAGADLRLDDADRAAVSERLYELYRVMVTAPVPIVAVIDGPAVGGGAQLAVASDVRVGGRGASFRFPGPGHGLAVGAWALPSLVGRGRAVELCLTMRTVDAVQAAQIGLLDRLVDDPVTVALDQAAAFAQLDASAAARVKAITRDASGLLDALEQERAGNAAWSGAVEALKRKRS
ncbi:MAG TPA: enoyl-CoA hydratase/isomerase family protein [Solirubrobacteraceae bacterium]|jgi:enoyl-CoA hydratase/carnithine racemase